MINTKVELIEHLRALGNGEILPRSELSGVCNELFGSRTHSRFANRCIEYMREWPEHSGDTSYPVRGPKGQRPDGAYYYVPPEQMWRVGEYAAARRRLCTFLADKLEQEWNEV